MTITLERPTSTRATADDENWLLLGIESWWEYLDLPPYMDVELARTYDYAKQTAADGDGFAARVQLHLSDEGQVEQYAAKLRQDLGLVEFDCADSFARLFATPAEDINLVQWIVFLST